MFVEVNGARLFVDIEGSSLVVDGPAMRGKPTLVLLHGGPGFDHSGFKPTFSQLSDIAQIVYVDHRGSGRSIGDDPATWNLAQWGDDVKGLCDALGIAKPIVYGVSFGGFVAQSFATRHPDHLSRLILTSTAAKVDFPTIFAAFERLGGPAARAAAEAYWLGPSAETRARYFEVCLPLYRRHPGDPAAFKRAIIRNDVAIWFNGPHNEQGRMDFRADLARITCPVLVLAGEMDPITPIAFSETIAQSLTNSAVQFERFDDCGHGVIGDHPERAMDLIRRFIEAVV
ncbi:alpha/beta hydrolase [Phreatobacter aquaticus]|uniref:Alpha/beta hydrolase n=1 Tax=Phreatobacter aquaticus TaxID=2570229 RepID=A0A4D7QH35_9HYPH|nr:alpha/beta hydrolase [Phreatobacter aquaticus]QCK84776.1 alpha/beta hydrolase [Phreatobacter aquaticus]